MPGSPQSSDDASPLPTFKVLSLRLAQQIDEILVWIAEKSGHGELRIEVAKDKPKMFHIALSVKPEDA